MAANGGLEASECAVISYFGGSKVVVLGIQQVWLGCGGDREVSESGAGSNGPWCAGTEIGYAQVGE